MSVDIFHVFNESNQPDWIIAPLTNESLERHTSIGVGGPADLFVTVSNEDELRWILHFIATYELHWCALGKGTNLLVPDSGFRGVVISLKGKFTEIVINGNSIEAGAGVSNRKLAKTCKMNHLTGVEFLDSIPGSVGGAITMNAGAFGERMSTIIEWVEYVDLAGSLHQAAKEELKMSYRHSVFTESPLLITRTSLKLHTGTIAEIVEKERRMADYRKQHHPINRKTWGSVFLNPPDKSAGSLIESCGLKGKGIGGAKISEKHANFIENTGNATFEDLMNTIKMARQAVLDKYGISLQTEGKIIGYH